LRRSEDNATQEQRLAAAASEAREHKLARKTAEDQFATAVEQLEEAQASCQGSLWRLSVKALY
jgi:hypothetical protein